MAKKKPPIDEEDELFDGKWQAMNNAQRAAFLENQFDVLTRNNNEIAKKVGATAADIAQIKRDADSFREWANYERSLTSVLDRDLVAEAKAVELFDNTKDPRDRSDEPEPPEHLRDKVALLWPF